MQNLRIRMFLSYMLLHSGEKKVETHKDRLGKWDKVNPINACTGSLLISLKSRLQLMKNKFS